MEISDHEVCALYRCVGFTREEYEKLPELFKSEEVGADFIKIHRRLFIERDKIFKKSGIKGLCDEVLV